MLYMFRSTKNFYFLQVSCKRLFKPLIDITYISTMYQSLKKNRIHKVRALHLKKSKNCILKILQILLPYANGCNYFPCKIWEKKRTHITKVKQTPPSG